jgi:hypothetical protein
MGALAWLYLGFVGEAKISKLSHESTTKVGQKYRESWAKTHERTNES